MKLILLMERQEVQDFSRRIQISNFKTIIFKLKLFAKETGKSSK